MCMDVNQWIYFVEIAHRKSFSKAAKALHISQPAISKAIRSLEEEGGTQLFFRANRTVELTPQGKALLPQAEDVVNRYEALGNSLKKKGELEHSVLQVAIPPMVGSSFISPFLQYFLSAYPQIQLEIREVGCNEVPHYLENGEVQVGVLGMPNRELPYKTYIFSEESMEIVLPPGFPLNGRRGLTLQDIRDYPVIDYPDEFSLHHLIRAAFQREMLDYHVVCCSSNWDFVIEMARAGMGVALMPERVCDRLPKGHVAHVPLLEPKIPWVLGMIWQDKGYVSPATKVWVDEFQKFFSANVAKKAAAAAL